jgi:hypothetical protein
MSCCREADLQTCRFTPHGRSQVEPEGTVVRTRDADAEGEGRFELQEWVSAVGGLTALLLGAMLILGLVYLLVAAH